MTVPIPPPPTTTPDATRPGSSSGLAWLAIAVLAAAVFWAAVGIPALLTVYRHSQWDAHATAACDTAIVTGDRAWTNFLERPGTTLSDAEFEKKKAEAVTEAGLSDVTDLRRLVDPSGAPGEKADLETHFWDVYSWCKHN